jgi:hypothetical protein
VQVVIGSDLTGFAVTQDGISHLRGAGHTPTDVGRFVYSVTQFLCWCGYPIAQFCTDPAFRRRVAKLAAMEAS